ncbi:MAG: hypothetical protein AB7L84_09090 [Acidimicrobiia bacterium]
MGNQPETEDDTRGAGGGPAGTAAVRERLVHVRSLARRLEDMGPLVFRSEEGQIVHGGIWRILVLTYRRAFELAGQAPPDERTAAELLDSLPDEDRRLHEVLLVGAGKGFGGGHDDVVAAIAPHCDRLLDELDRPLGDRTPS